MKRDILYEAAFRYKKAGLWKKLWDSDVFAVKLKRGKIGYISIMGRNGEYNALGLYIGEEGFGSYRIMANAGSPTGSLFKDHEILIQQNCLQAALECKEALLPEEVEEVRSYAKSNGIRLSGRNAYPQFVKFEPGCYPWKVKTQEDMMALHTAMVAAVLLAEVLQTTNPATMGILPVGPDTEEVPLFEVKNNKLIQAGFASLPGDIEEKYEYVTADNQIALASVKKLPRKGIWESELVCLTEPVQNEPEETPYYPMLLMVVESRSGYVLPVPMIGRLEKNTQKMLQAFADAWRTEKTYPKEIRCRDKRTFALLKDFCEKTDVKISIYDRDMPALDEAEEAILNHTFGENEEEDSTQIEELADMILSLSREDLRQIPKPVLKQIQMMITDEIFPKDIAAKLMRKLKNN